MSELGSNANGVRKAIEKFQRYAQIPVTGKMDDATKAKLTGPRCGAKDTEPTNVVQGVAISFRDMRRRKRYVQQGSTWKKTVMLTKTSFQGWKLKGK